MTYHGHLPCTLFVLCFADYVKLIIVYEVCAYLRQFQHPLSLAYMIFRPDLYISMDGLCSYMSFLLLQIQKGISTILEQFHILEESWS